MGNTNTYHGYDLDVVVVDAAVVGGGREKGKIRDGIRNFLALGLPWAPVRG